MPVGPEPMDLTSQLKDLYEKQPEKKELKKSLYKFLSSKNTPSRQSLSHPEITPVPTQPTPDTLADFAEIISSKQAMSVSHARVEEGSQQEAMVSPGGASAQHYSSVKASIMKATQELQYTLSRESRMEQENVGHRRKSLSKGKGISLMQSNTAAIDFKRSHPLKCEVDLAYINSRTELIPRKCR